MENENIIQVFDIKDFEKWLKKNHKKEKKVKIVLHKKHTGNKAPNHRQQLEMAICYGWVDTTVNKIDEETFSRKFVKRTENSKWSNNTIGYAKELTKQGKMSPQGTYFFQLGLAKPTHDQGIPKNPEIPLELEKALNKNKKAKENFYNFSPSSRKVIYRWLLRAKLSKTKEKRIKKILELALENKKLF